MTPPEARRPNRADNHRKGVQQVPPRTNNSNQVVPPLPARRNHNPAPLETSHEIKSQTTRTPPNSHSTQAGRRLGRRDNSTLLRLHPIRVNMLVLTPRRDLHTRAPHHRVRRPGAALHQPRRATMANRTRVQIEAPWPSTEDHLNPTLPVVTPSTTREGRRPILPRGATTHRTAVSTARRLAPVRTLMEAAGTVINPDRKGRGGCLHLLPGRRGLWLGKHWELVNLVV